MAQYPQVGLAACGPKRTLGDPHATLELIDRVVALLGLARRVGLDRHAKARVAQGQSNFRCQARGAGSRTGQDQGAQARKAPGHLFLDWVVRQ